MRRIIYALVIVVFSFGSVAEARASLFNTGLTETDTISVSLLTASQGKQIYEKFGHTGIRIHIPSKRFNGVYHYGLFSFDEPYFDPNVETVKGKSEEEALEASQKYPVENPFDFKDSEFISAEDKDPKNYNKDSVKESLEEFDGEIETLNEIRITTEGLNNFKPYGEAAQITWTTIQDKNKVATFEFMLEDMYPNGIGSTQLNDLLAYNRDWIYDMLNITDSEEVAVEGAEEKEEVIDDSFDW